METTAREFDLTEKSVDKRTNGKKVKAPLFSGVTEMEFPVECRLGFIYSVQRGQTADLTHSMSNP